MKKFLVVVFSTLSFLAMLPQLPAHAGVGEKCGDIIKTGTGEDLSWCVGISHSHNGYLDSAYFQFDDHTCNCVYYVDDVILRLYDFDTGGNLAYHEWVNGFPVYTGQTTVWANGDCTYYQQDSIQAQAFFTIEWDPGVLGNQQTRTSEIKMSIECT